MGAEETIKSLWVRNWTDGIRVRRGLRERSRVSSGHTFGRCQRTALLGAALGRRTDRMKRNRVISYSTLAGITEEAGHIARVQQTSMGCFIAEQRLITSDRLGQRGVDGESALELDAEV